MKIDKRVKGSINLPRWSTTNYCMTTQTERQGLIKRVLRATIYGIMKVNSVNNVWKYDTGMKGTQVSSFVDWQAL